MKMLSIYIKNDDPEKQQLLDNFRDQIITAARECLTSFQSAYAHPLDIVSNKWLSSSTTEGVHLTVILDL